MTYNQLWSQLSALSNRFRNAAKLKIFIKYDGLVSPELRPAAVFAKGEKIQRLDNIIDLRELGRSDAAPVQLHATTLSEDHRNECVSRFQA